jgi:hypothetical protein
VNTCANLNIVKDNFLIRKEKNLTNILIERLLLPTYVIVFCSKHPAICMARCEVMSQSERTKPIAKE